MEAPLAHLTTHAAAGNNTPETAPHLPAMAPGGIQIPPAPSAALGGLSASPRGGVPTAVYVRV